MADSQMKTRKEFERGIIMKAWKDPAFAKALKKDPKGTLQKELAAIDPNFKLPAEMKIQVFQEDAKNLYLVIPEHPKEAVKRAEFSDDQLESAAGGSISVVAVVAVAVAGAANAVGAVNAQLAANANTEANTNALHNANVQANVNA
ncbi:MAG: NHLP leader peptide family natural product precursor [bacterium]|nr:NHLP leader peptide family natural product precursor [bacterium]